MELIEIMHELKKKGYKITNTATIKNNKFVDYQYFTFETNNRFFYMEYNGNHFLYDLTPISITAYLKIDWNHKQQLFYSRNVRSFEDIEKTIEEAMQHFKPLKNTSKQRIYYDFSTYINTEYGRMTKFEYLKKQAGFREKQVLNDIKHVEHLQNDDSYNVVCLTNSTNENIIIELNTCRFVG